MKELFKYLNPNENNLLSKLTNDDLIEIINMINNYDLEYRETLNIDNNYTFGTEIEVENANENSIRNDMDLKDIKSYWKIKRDNTLICGLELNSPIMVDTLTCWKDLKNVCEILKRNSYIDKNCGAHIHIGTNILKDDNQFFLDFIYFWSVYENIIFRFSYGEYLNGRPNIQSYAPSVRKSFDKYYQENYNRNYSFMHHIKLFSFEKNQSVNFKNINNPKVDKNTIEFRCPNGTYNPIIWQNNINFFMKILLFLQNKENINYDILNKRKEIINSKYYYLNYNEIYLDQSLEFADLVFDNNLDKIYFLRQYLKNNEIEKFNHTYKKSRKFTK